jgi:hypothetical protein
MLIYVDIDETICSRPAPAGLDYNQSTPYPERIERINQLYRGGHTIVYWTARGTKTGINHFRLTKDQLDRWGCQYHELRMGKPAFDLLIDDKSIESGTFFRDGSPLLAHATSDKANVP